MRRKGKPKKIVRCTMCTPHRWMGNHKDRYDHKTKRDKQVEV